eukprot:218244_1
MKSKIVFKKIKITNKIKKKKTIENINILEKKNEDDNIIFKHFTTHSMKIVNCIIENKKHLLYQFVTSNKSKLSSNSKTNSLKISKNQKKSQNISVPPPPVFQPYINNNKDLDIDVGLLSSTLSSIQTALNVNNINDNDDFDFDFNTISNNMYDQPPMKKRKMAIDVVVENNNGDIKEKDNVVNSEQLTELLAYLCDNKGSDDNTEKVTPSRYPKPKAPTMKESNTKKNKHSNWTNVVDLNRY